MPFFLVRWVFVGMLAAQFLSAQQKHLRNSHVDFYFPQVADGGTEAAKWQTVIRFVNSSGVNASVKVEFYRGAGVPWEIDFGSGAKAVHEFTVSRFRTLEVKSNMNSTSTVSGWARGQSSSEILALASFRQYIDGRPSQEVTTPSTQPARRYVSFAAPGLGVAIANPNSEPINLEMAVSVPSGTGAPIRYINLPALGHVVLNVAGGQPGGDGGDHGYIEIRPGQPAPGMFVAWTMNADSTGTFASLPDGALSPSRSQPERIRLAFSSIRSLLIELGSTRIPKLEILPGDGITSSLKEDGTVALSIGTAELFSDADAELTAFIAHLVAHMFIQPSASVEDNELKADEMSLFLLIWAGHDPYALVGMLGRLYAAASPEGLDPQMEGMAAAEQHTLIRTRLDRAFAAIRKHCNSHSDYKTMCDRCRLDLHPHLPNSPL